MSAAAVIIARQNRFMRVYYEAGATTPSAALAPEQLNIRPSWVFRRMVRAGVFVPVGAGHYYLDIAAAHQFRAHRRVKSLIMLAVVLLGVLIFMAIRSL